MIRESMASIPLSVAQRCCVGTGRWRDSLRCWCPCCGIGASDWEPSTRLRPRPSRRLRPKGPQAMSSPLAVRDAQQRSALHRRYLMCRPTHFTVAYRINPWMHPAEPTDTDLALAQWQRLHDAYLALGHDIELIDPLPGLPDMVYAANGGFTLDGVAYTAKFTHPERQAEGPAYGEWFRA